MCITHKAVIRRNHPPAVLMFPALLILALSAAFRVSRTGQGRLLPAAWLLALLAVSWPGAGLAKGLHYGVTRWDMRDGLPHNMVHDIAQDRQGFIWVATWEGVARFNGRSFTVYDNENTEQARLSGVFSLLAEADGSILVGTAVDGIYRHHQGQWHAYGDAALRQLRVEDMLRTADGTLWLSSRHQLYRLDAQGRPQHVDFPSGIEPGQIHALRADGDDLLVASLNGAWQVHNGRARPWGQAQGFAGKQVRQIDRDGAGGWVLACDDGVWRWHADGRSERVVASSRISQTMVDSRQALWVVGNDGQVLRIASDGSRQQLALDGLPSRAFLEDREGLLWLGDSLGLTRLSPGAVRALTQRNGLGENYVRTVMQTANGSTWIGHARGIQRWQGGALGPLLAMPDARLSSTVTALAADPHGDGVWAGTYEQGVLRFDGAGRLLQQLPVSYASARSLMVRSLLPTSQGMLVGTPRGLLRLGADGQVQPLGKQLGLGEHAVQVLSRDEQGQIWIGTEAGMAMLRPDGRLRHWQPERDLPAYAVFDFLHDADGTVWVASDSGLLRLRDGALQVYDHHAGLPRDKMFRILDDGHGRLWLSSNQGVFRVARSEFAAFDANRHDLLAVDVIDSSDGMPSSQVNGATWPAGWQHRDGQLMFPTGRGLALIDPELAGRDRNAVPPVVLEQVLVNGVRQPLQAAYRLQQRTNRLSITYAALAFASPHKLRYRYRLLGFERDWVEVGEGTEAVYTNLPPGDYRFQVQAMAMPLDWSRSQRLGSAELAIVQVPVFWQRPLVLATAALLLGLLLFSGWRLRVHHYERRQRRLNALVAQRTEELHRKNVALVAAGRERDELLGRLERQALYDSLTALPNRRAADGYLQQALDQAAASGTPLSVALMDVDHFKQVNDGYGHQVGDRVLAHLGRLLSEPSEGAVFAARQGGEEFLLVMPNTALARGRQRMQVLCTEVAGAQLAQAPAITVSIGVAGYGPGRDQVHTLLAAADANLYLAKAGGRNQVVG